MSFHIDCFIAALAIALAPAALSAQAVAPITFDDAIRIALRQNGALQLAKNSASVDATGVRQQQLQFLPDLRASTQTGQNYGRTFSQADGRIVDQTTNSLSAGLSSSVTLFNGFSNVASLKEAQLTENASSRDVKRAEQTVVFTVASNYLALIQAQEQLRIQRENLAAQQAQEAQIKAFVDAGSRPIADLYQQQATTAAAQSTVVDAERTVELAKVDAIQTLQLDPKGSYEFAAPAIATQSVATPLDLDALLTRALAQRVDLEAQEDRVDASRQGVRAAEGSRWPTISLNAGYNTGFSSAADAAFLDQLDQRRGGSLGVGISIPLFDRGSTAIASERAQLQANTAQIALKNARQDVALQVRRAYLDFRSAQQRATAAEAQLRAADLALTSTQERYRVGAAALLELTQARSSRVQAESALIDARYTLTFQKTLIDYYVGDLDPQHVSLS
jgi:outer membrane protein